MDFNGCDMDVDVRLPPRKRLLAGLKKQSLNPSVDQGSRSEFDARLSNLLKSYKNGSKMSPEEIALGAKSAAEAAAKAAEVARAAAEEKAVIAAKAVAAAKSALGLVAYEENCGEDEELARRLHRAMNSSPRIFNNSPSSNAKNHKKLKIHSPNTKSGVTDSTSVREGNVKYYNWNYPEEKSFEGTDYVCINGRTRKRGRIKQKRLSLSTYASKDQTNPKEELNLTNSLLTRARIDKSTARNLSLLSGKPSVANVTPMEVSPT